MLFVLTPEQIKAYNIELEDWWSTLSWNTKQQMRELYFSILDNDIHAKNDIDCEQEHPEAKIGQ